ncbi:polysaccharide lyase family 7 protein [Pseudomonas syringae pv. actinidiae]|nr:polysaccharide lyase family 7 protein [Pseudomonas syringae pv. actinidiae]
MATACNAAPESQQYSKPGEFRLSGVSLVETSYKKQAALKVTMPSSSYQDQSKERLLDRDFMAWLPLDFKDGTIEVDVASDLAADAPSYARGFVGVAFRIDNASRFESIYLRPTNSQADDQVRRNHTVQYAGYPDFRFDQLRKEFPEKYETYADVELGRWIHIKIVVDGSKATLYLDHKEKPAFVVNDLKFGNQQHGGVGVWIESGTIAHFRALRVTHQ